MAGPFRDDLMFVCVEIGDDKENTEGQRLLVPTEAQGFNSHGLFTPIRRNTEKTKRNAYKLGICDMLLLTALFVFVCFILRL